MAWALGIEVRDWTLDTVSPVSSALPKGLQLDTRPAVSPGSDLWLPGQLSQAQSEPQDYLGSIKCLLISTGCC